MLLISSVWSRAAKHVILLDRWNGSKFFKVFAVALWEWKTRIWSCVVTALFITDAFFFFFMQTRRFWNIFWSVISLLFWIQFIFSALSISEHYLPSCHHYHFLVPCPLFLPLLFQVSHCNFRTFMKHLIFVPIFCHPIDSLSCSLYCQHILRSR